MKEMQVPLADPDVTITIRLKSVGDGIATDVTFDPKDDCDLHPTDVFITVLETWAEMSEQFGIEAGTSVIDLNDNQTIQ